MAKLLRQCGMMSLNFDCTLLSVSSSLCGHQVPVTSSSRTIVLYRFAVLVGLYVDITLSAISTRAAHRPTHPRGTYNNTGFY